MSECNVTYILDNPSINITSIHHLYDQLYICDIHKLQAVNEAARGYMSAESVQLVKSLSRDLTPEHHPAVHLFATNLQVQAYNMDCLIDVSTIMSCPALMLHNYFMDYD
jgi:hypothetical protein